MNGSGDIPLTYSPTADDTRPCGLISIIPALGMASCRGRAEAFARSLSSKLKTLGSPAHNDLASEEEKSIINGTSTNTWVASHGSDETVTNLQPLRHESNSFFDFDCELESPGSPVDEKDYLQLIETSSNTPHNVVHSKPPATASEYVCTVPNSSENPCDDPYYEVEILENITNFNETTKATSPVEELSENFTSLKLNRSVPVLEQISNGSDIQPSNNNESPFVQHQDENNQHFQDIKNSTPEIIQKENISPAKKETEPEHLLSTEESTIQDQIINELQKQSEAIAFCRIEQSEINISEPTVVSENLTTTDTRTSADVLTPGENFTSASQQHNSEDCSVEVTASKLEKPLTETEKEITANESLLNSKSKKPTTDSTYTHNSVLDTDDEDDCRPQRVRRCSSLKTGKTPPGTPSRKKIVRFADVLGLDLADVKTFLDEVPTIPKSAFEDLEIMDSEQPIQLGPKSDKLLMPLFQQPGGLSTFLDVVREKQVSLDNAAISDPINQTIIGSVRVRNLDFHKSVHIRYSLDGWRSFADLKANYVPNSCDGFSDKFTFVLFGNSLQIGQRLEFAVRFQCKGQQFWDNNYGMNYCFQCLPTATPANHIQSMVSSNQTDHMVGLLSSIGGDSWCSSFY